MSETDDAQRSGPEASVRYDLGGWISGPMLDPEHLPAHVLTREEESALWRLRNVWQDAYKIEVVDGIWRAARVDDPTKVFTAESPVELTTVLQADYRQWVKGQPPTEAPGSSV